MGYMRHHAIVVTSWDEKAIEAAHKEALTIFDTCLGLTRDSYDVLVSPIVGVVVNGGGSFFIGPDGSKEGWEHDRLGDQLRDQFIEWLDAQRYDDDSTSLAWVEVQFGDDNLETRVVRDSDERHRTSR